MAAAALGGVLAWPGRARALGPQQKIQLVQVRYDGGWRVHDSAVASMAQTISYRTSIETGADPPALRLDDPRMSQHAIAILSGDRDFRFSRTERDALKRWIDLGGFLIVDNTGATKTSKPFEAAVQRELSGLYPQTPLERISPEHVIYRSFYRVDYPAGRVIRKAYVQGLPVGRRYGVVYTANDMLGAFETDGRGLYDYTPTPGGDGQREEAFRFGINLVMYALCLHYKDDQVHLDYLLHKRKWKIHKPD